MTRSRLPDRSLLRRRAVAAGFAVALPLTMAVSCGGEEPVVGEQEEGEEQNLEQEDDADDQGDD